MTNFIRTVENSFFGQYTMGPGNEQRVLRLIYDDVVNAFNESQAVHTVADLNLQHLGEEVVLRLNNENYYGTLRSIRFEKTGNALTADLEFSNIPGAWVIPTDTKCELVSVVKAQMDHTALIAAEDALVRTLMAERARYQAAADQRAADMGPHLGFTVNPK